VGWFRRRPWLTAVLVVAYLALLVTTLGWPYPVEGDRGTRFVFLLDAMLSVGVGSRTTLIAIEVVSNVLLFLPLGLILWWVLGRLRILRNPWVHLVVALACGMVVSISAELFQREFLPERTGDVRDVVSNSIGAAIGCVLGLVLDRVEARQAASARPEPD